MGPSWYWMPDVFESYFKEFGYNVDDFYELKRLDPSYQVFFEDKKGVDIPASLDKVYELFDSIEPNSSTQLRKFLNEAA